MVLPTVQAVWRDAIVALRSLRKSPGVAATIVLTLALSIGATTAMFSIVNGVLLAPLPFANADRLVWTVNRGTRPYDAMSPPDLADWSRLNDAFEEVGGYLATSVDLSGGGAPQHLSSAEVTGNWFTMLGVRMAVGRSLLPDDEGPDKPKVVVLSHRLWQTQFGGVRSIPGHTVLLDGTRYTVVGVVAAGFALPADADVWRPVLIDPRTRAGRGSRAFRGPIALIKRGVSFDLARQKARLAAAQIHAQYPTDETGLDFDIQPLRDHLVGDSTRLIVLLFGAVAMLLLIACANVATLMLIRAANRSAETGIRLALGASSWRIGSQIIIESLLIAGAGTLLGIVVALFGVSAIVDHESGALPLLSNVAVNWTVLSFSAAVTVLAGVGFGAMPALHAARTDVVAALKSGGRGATADKAATTGRRTLVALELALVVPLLVAATLLSKSFSRLVRVDPGFRAGHIVRFDLTLPRCGTAWSPDTTCAGYEGPRYMTPASIEAFSRELDARLRAIVGTEGVAIAHGVPFTEWAINGGTIALTGFAPPPVDRPNPVEVKYATPGYFALLGVPVLEGRAFSDADRLDTRPVALVSGSAVRAYFGGQSPIGRHLIYHNVVGPEIVGVVGDTKTQGFQTTPEPALYYPFWQTPIYYMTVLIRSHGNQSTVMHAARREVAAIDPSLPVFHLMPYSSALEASAAPARLAANVVAGFAASALLLAMIGIYGVASYAVRERRREIGIRIALGAPYGGVLRLVLRDGLFVAGVGLMIGVALSVVAGQLLRGLLFGVGMTDPSSYAIACCTPVVLIGIASWLPARRAARIDPLIAMRPE